MGAFKAPMEITGVPLGRIFFHLFSSKLEEFHLLPGCKLVCKLCTIRLCNGF